MSEQPTRYASYFEVILEDGNLLASLGSGPSRQILARSHAHPSIRVLLAEPTDGSVRFRARCGVAELTASGLTQVTEYDSSQERGAWVGVLAVGSRVLTVLDLAYENGRLSPALLRGLSTGWLEVLGDAITATDLETASNALTGFEQSAQRIFVRLDGPSEQITRALSMLRAASIDHDQST